MMSLAKFSLMLSTISPLFSVIHCEISEKSATVASSWNVTMYCLAEDSVEIEAPSLTSLARAKIEEERRPRRAAKMTRSKFMIEWAQLKASPGRGPRCHPNNQL